MDGNVSLPGVGQPGRGLQKPCSLHLWDHPMAQLVLQSPSAPAPGSGYGPLASSPYIWVCPGGWGLLHFSP